MIPHHEILFRQLHAPVPTWTLPGKRWAVEFWFADMAWPVGQLWVFDPGAPPCVTYDRMPPCGDMLHVNEHYRRQGIATDLLKAALERWPALLYDAATYDGEEFLKAFAKRG